MMKHKTMKQLLSMLKEAKLLWHFKELCSLQETEIYEAFSR